MIQKRKWESMLRSWRVGRAFGIDIYLHWSFWALPLIHIFSFGAYTPRTAAFSVAFTALLATCVVVHEFGHILAARMFGIGTRDIYLTPLGGLARLERMSEKPIEEIIIALAGPAVNVVIAAGLMVPAIRYGESWNGGRIDSGLQLLTAALILNIGLVVFNMVPAFPLDGGRVFRAFLAYFTDRLTATRIAVYVGMVFAILLAITGLVQGAFLWVLIAGFIIMAGQAELFMLKRVEAVRRQARAEVDLLPLDDEPLPVRPPEPNFSGYTWDARLSAWVEWRDGWAVRKCGMHTW